MVQVNANQSELLDKLVKEDEVLTWLPRHGKDRKARVLDHWDKAAELLNKLGPFKTGEQWRRSWCLRQKRRLAKEKAENKNANRISQSEEDAQLHSNISDQQILKPLVAKKKNNVTRVRKKDKVTAVNHHVTDIWDDNTCRRMIRAVSIGILFKNKTEYEVLQEIDSSRSLEYYAVWTRMRLTTLEKLNRLLSVNDCETMLEPENIMTVTEWLLFDTVLVHQNYDFIRMCNVTCRDRKCLVDLYNLVEQFNIESLIGDQLAEGWVAVTMNYNKQHHHCTPMLLQRRWHQLKVATKNRFQKFWSEFRGDPDRFNMASKYAPTPLQQQIAKQHRILIALPVKSWEEMIKQKMVILWEHFHLIALNRAKGIEKPPVPAPLPENPWNENIIVIGAKTSSPQSRPPSPDDEIKNVAIKLEQEMDIDIEENPIIQTPVQNTTTLITSVENTSFNESHIQDTTVTKIKEEFHNDANSFPREEINIDKYPPDEDEYVLRTDPESIQVDPDSLIVKQENQDIWTISIEPIASESIKSEAEIANSYGDIPIVDETQLNAIRKYVEVQITQANLMGVQVLTGNNNTINVNVQEESASGLVETPNEDPIKFANLFDTAVDLDAVNSIGDWVGQQPNSENCTDENSSHNQDSTALDEKLTMIPMVYMIRLDDMDILPIRLPNTISDKHLLVLIQAKSKPTVPNKTAKSTKTKGYQMKNTLKYTPEQLKNNPDFNIILKKFNKRFFSITRNRLLLRQCMPLTVDVSKEFEKRLVDGRMYLKPSDLKSRIDLPTFSAASVKETEIKPSNPLIVPSLGAIVPKSIPFTPAPVLPVSKPSPSLIFPLPITVPKIESSSTTPLVPASLPSVPASLPSVPAPTALTPSPIPIASTPIALQSNKDGVFTAVQYRSSVAPEDLPKVPSYGIITNIQSLPLIPLEEPGFQNEPIPKSANVDVQQRGPSSTDPSEVSLTVDEPQKTPSYTISNSDLENTSFEYKEDDPNSLLSLEILDNMLNVLSNVKELRRDEIQISYDYDCNDDQNSQTGNATAYHENPDAVDDKSMQRKRKNKNLSFCCWAQERVNQIKNKLKAKTPHTCLHSQCNCCCKEKLAKLNNPDREESPTLINYEHEICDESSTDSFSNENNLSVAQESVFSLQTTNKNTTVTNTTNTDSVKIISTQENPNDFESIPSIPDNTNMKNILDPMKEEQIFLDDTKILLTTAKFPDNFKLFEHYERNMKRKLHLPESIDMKLSPKGYMSIYKKRHAEINDKLLQELKDCVAIFHEECVIKKSYNETSPIKSKVSPVLSKDNRSIYINQILGQSPAGSILRNILESNRYYLKDDESTFRFINNFILRDKIKHKLSTVLNKGLIPIQTPSQVKYACSVNGLFFKLDLKTNHLKPLSIFIKGQHCKDFVPLIRGSKIVSGSIRNIPKETKRNLNISYIRNTENAPDNIIARETSDEHEQTVSETQNTPIEKEQVYNTIKSMRSFNTALKSNIHKRTMKALRLLEELNHKLRKKQESRQKARKEVTSSSEEEPTDDGDSDQDPMQEDEVEIKEEFDLDGNTDPLKLEIEDYY